MPTLSVIAGPNGSGKSTFTSSVRFEGDAHLIDPDSIAKHLNPSQPSDSTLAAGREAVLRCRTLLADRASFAVETTLSGKGTLATIKDAKRTGYQVLLVYVALDTIEMQIDRVRLRVSQGGHDIPDDDIRRRYWRSLMHAPEAIALADKSTIFENSGSEPVPKLLFESGRVIWQADSLPPWVQELRARLS